MPAKIINKTKTEKPLEFQDLSAGDWFDYAGYVYLKIEPVINSYNDTLSAMEIEINRVVIMGKCTKVKLLKNVEISYEEA